MENNLKVKPFLRWAGGKRWLVKHIDRFIPEKFNNYFEPFVGGGAIFIYLINTKKISQDLYLSDSNEELINCYQQVRSNVEAIIKTLSTLSNSEACYYKVREKEYMHSARKAARFLFLNQTSYNGIHRINRAGKYNVPYGYRKNTLESYCDFPNLRNISLFLKNDNFHFTHGDFFDNVKEKVSKDDFIFLDPPYTVAHENNGFIQYNQRIFSWKDQKRLALLLKHINRVGAYYLMTNAAHQSISELFSPYGRKIDIYRSCNIGGTGANRSKIKEFIYTNVGEKS